MLGRAPEPVYRSSAPRRVNSASLPPEGDLTRDRGKLQTWYRQAMLKRIAELRDLRSRLESIDQRACDAARQVGQALRGSGATFGFPHITAVATLVETSADEDVLRRVEGLIEELGVVTTEDRGGATIGPEWLGRAAGLGDSAPDLGELDLDHAWATVARLAGLAGADLARKVAEYFRTEVAEDAPRGRAALRLVPEALVTSAQVVPLYEDSITITVATAKPTSLATELELERLTGRRPRFAVAPPEAITALIEESYGPRHHPTRGHAPAAQEGGAAEDVGGDHTRAGGPERKQGLEESTAPEKNEARQEATAEERGGAAAPETVDADLQNQTVLVVDDEPSARLLTRSVLEKRGWSVIEAADGLDALDVMRRGQDVGLVVADLKDRKSVV